MTNVFADQDWQSELLEVVNKHNSGTLTFKSVARAILSQSKAKNWYNDHGDLNGHLTHLHSEVSEIYEAYRNFGLCSVSHFDDNGKPQGVPSEIADVIIKAIALAVHLGIDIESELVGKMVFNASRPRSTGRF